MSPSTRRRARSQDSGLDQLQIEDGRVVEDRMVLPGIANGPQEEDGQFGGHLVPIPMTPMTRGTATPVQTTPVRPPQGNPQVLMPQGQVQPSTPLFDEEQLNRLNRLHESAPHLYGLQKEVVEEPVPPRPRFLEQDGVNVTNRQLQRQCVDLMDENEKLRRELDQIREGVFQTPSDDKKIPDEPPGLGMSQETARRVLYSESPLEMFVRMTSKPDAGLPSVSASAPPLGREREDQGRPRPLQQGRVDGRGGGMEQEPVQPAGRKDHRQLDLMEKLVQLMIEDKVGGGQKTELLVESVKPGTTTLVELPEVSTTAPIDLQDWLTAVEPAMGDLSDSSSSWWTTLLEEAQSWYLKDAAIAEIFVCPRAFGYPQAAEVEQGGEACGVTTSYSPSSTSSTGVGEQQKSHSFEDDRPTLHVVPTGWCPRERCGAVVAWSAGGSDILATAGEWPSNLDEMEEEVCGFGIVATRCYNSHARVVKDDETSSWIGQGPSV